MIAVPKGGDWAEGSKEGVIVKAKRDRVMGSRRKIGGASLT
jgi:hypothetical protein